MKKTLWILFAIIVILGGAYFAINKKSASKTEDPQITSFTVQKPNLLIEGKNLSKVDIIGIPTGTGITEADYVTLGTATLMSTSTLQIDAAADPALQAWILPIPKDPMLLTSVIARGYGKGAYATSSVDRSLSYTGATELYTALWGQTPTTTPTSTPPTPTTTPTSTPKNTTGTSTLSLAVGQSGAVGDLNIKLIKISEDSRCPKAVQCIQAGEVGVVAEVTVAGATKSITLRTSDSAPYVTGRYSISLGSVSPQKIVGVPIAEGDYRITFLITQK